MKYRLLVAATFSTMTSWAHAHEIINAPYLQSASPSDLWVMWESTGGEETRVNYGTSPSLGNTATGTYIADESGARIHEAQLAGLQPATRYYYQVTTADASSDVYHFITPPSATSEASFRMVAMSDMQQDFLHPEVYYDIIHDGIIDLISANYGSDMAAELGLVIIPGDLVDNGTERELWQDTFFAPGADLMSQVPFYPVLGNHEQDTPYYEDYFHLPENGTPDYDEHWYFTDYSNIRIVGMDSNTGYRLQVQLDWLDDVLDDACSNDALDFVFVQLHHPYLSELWPDGEADFTGEVIARLEAFSAECGKPSVHFFGHTHGYSRGQSRDHTHLWVNVATAGGNIDYWGEYPNQEDYLEFTKSQDEYGFVLLEVNAGNAPTFRLRRYSRGDAFTTLDNEVTDDITIRRYNNVPTQPEALGPEPEDVDPDCVLLEASAFSDADADLHGASQFQVSRSCPDFSDLVVDSWQQYENWYREENTQDGVDLTQLEISLEPSTDYCWRVRYRDRSLGWSDWSAASAFTTRDTSNGACDSGDDSGGCGSLWRSGGYGRNAALGLAIFSLSGLRRLRRRKVT